MNTYMKSRGAENFDLREILLKNRKLNLSARAKFFESFINKLKDNEEHQHFRIIDSPASREVKVWDDYSKVFRKMLMFGSNNYLDLANNRYVIEKTQRYLDIYGAGMAGPPVLNGYTKIHKELEQRIAAFKGTEDALIFSSGYSANLGIAQSILTQNDLLFCDEFSHASFTDGLKQNNINPIKFEHNNINQLHEMLDNKGNIGQDRFIAIEGVYSMNGDIAPLDEIYKIKNKYNAIIILDDAHGTGVLGQTGRGTCEEFNLEGKIDIIMGTFSKAFGMAGGFVASSNEIINYMRYFARSYMFSAAMPNSTIASLLACLDILENDNDRINDLKINIKYAEQKLRSIGFDINANSPIIPISVPAYMNIRKMARDLQKMNIFVNSIEFPAVPVSKQCFRISLMSSHTKDDIDMLSDAFATLWHKYSLKDN